MLVCAFAAMLAIPAAIFATVFAVVFALVLFRSSLEPFRASGGDKTRSIAKLYDYLPEHDYAQGQSRMPRTFTKTG